MILTRNIPFYSLSRIAVLVLPILLLAFLGQSPVNAQGKKRGGGPALVKIDKVQLKSRITAQSFVGSLQPVRRSVIGSAVEERVDKVLVNDGDFVDAASNKANVLVELNHATIDLELEAAKIELELRQQALEELEITIPKQIAAANAEVGRIKAELSYAQKTYDRLKQLGSGGMSRKEIEESLSLLKSSQQALLAAEAEQQRLSSTQAIRIAIAKKNIARQQSEQKRIRDTRSKHTVVAPFTGFVTRRMVEQGNWVTRGTPLIEIVQLDPIELRVLVPQEYAIPLQNSFDSASKAEPLSASVRIDSVKQPIPGRIVRIIPDADPRTRSIPVIIEIENPKAGSGGHLLKPGLLARAELAIGAQEQVLMVPKDALVLNQGIASLYLVDRDSGKPMIRKETVTTGQSNDNWIEVTGNLKEGAEIVVQGNERLRDGVEVQVLKD